MAVRSTQKEINTNMKSLNEFTQQKISKQTIAEINNSIKKLADIANLLKQDALKVKNNENKRNNR